MSEISELLKLWQNKRRSSESVKRIAALHVANLDQRIAELVAMKRTLQHLVNCCHGDDRPECPILDQLGLAQP
jgi:MerR family copper efflux transcriptional regulator